MHTLIVMHTHTHTDTECYIPLLDLAIGHQLSTCIVHMTKKKKNEAKASAHVGNRRAEGRTVLLHLLHKLEIY